MERVFRLLGTAAFALTLFAGSVSIANACNKDFTIYNKSDHTIKGFYASPHNTTDWEENILGDDTLSPGEHMNIDMSDDKRNLKNYDVLARFSNGDKVTGANLNVCAADKVYIYNGEVRFTTPNE